MTSRRFYVLLGHLSGDAVYRHLVKSEPELIESSEDLAALITRM